jgi:peptide deformylase
MKIVAHNDPILSTKTEKFDFSNPPFDPIEFAKDFVKFMWDENAIGITANQVGVPYQIFSMRAYPQNFVCFNPRVVMPGHEQIVLEETAITHPGLLVKVKRPQHCRVRFQMPNGETRTETFTGLSARIFLQAVDNLNGIVYYNKANKFHKEQALKKWKKNVKDQGSRTILQPAG